MLVDRKLFPIYGEKDRAGLRIFDRERRQIYRAQFPERVFPDFASIPQPRGEQPAVHRGSLPVRSAKPGAQPGDRMEPLRAGRRGAGRRLFVPDADAGGGSTLATQIEKFRHSPQAVAPAASAKNYGRC